MREEVGKETPEKEMDLDVFFMTSHMTLSSASFRSLILKAMDRLYK